MRNSGIVRQKAALEAPAAVSLALPADSWSLLRGESRGSGQSILSRSIFKKKLTFRTHPLKIVLEKVQPGCRWLAHNNIARSNILLRTWYSSPNTDQQADPDRHEARTHGRGDGRGRGGSIHPKGGYASTTL